jgi:Carboxypeptidase regulatory-like domain
MRVARSCLRLWHRAVLAATLWLWVLFLPASSVGQPAPGAIRGTITDPSGSLVTAAIVTLQAAGSTGQRTTITDQAGSFHFLAVEPGTYTLTVTALGFAERNTNVTVISGDNAPLPPIVLQVAPALSEVNVGLSRRELATEQVHEEEKQRVLGIFPNFFVSYNSNAAPLSVKQKFQLGWKTIIDPVTFLTSGVTAGIEQWHNTYRQFGEGMEGYGKRFGADYIDTVNGVIIGHVLAQAVFHQDPRYFYKGTGGFRKRALYAIATAFVVKGDNGHWQPDYSDAIGGLAAGEISTLYYPASSRTGLRLFHNVLLGFGGRAAGNLLQEFLYREVTTHVPKMAGKVSPILREGTPVSLISVEDLRSNTPENSKPITFVLAKDIRTEGITFAKAGSQATGQATYVSVPPESAGSAAGIQLSLENVRLKLGNKDIPLRSAPQKGAGSLEYHWVEDTGRIALVLYTDRNVPVPAH